MVRHGCELEAKPTTIENQVVVLSFGSSQFVSSVGSRNRTHDENVAPNRSQKIQQKLLENTLQKGYNHKKARNFIGGFCSFVHMIS